MSTADDPRSGKLVARTCTEVILDHSRSGGPDDAADGLKPLSAFRSKQAYVLLGDPGAGKTTELEREYEAMGDAAVMLSARDFIALHIDSHPEWQGKTLFIDGLDEVRAGQADARAPLDEIRGRLDQLGRPRFRVSCREVDWIGGNDWSSLKKVSPDSEMAVLRLDPLHDRAACELLSELANSGGTNTGDVNADRASSGDERAKRLEAEEFVEQARLRGVGSMLKNPLTLRLLFKAVTDAGEWPESQLKTFEMACRQMAVELNGEHLAADQIRHPTPEGLMSAAGYLCALLLLSDSDGYTLTRDSPADSDVSSDGPRIVSVHSLADAEADAVISDPRRRGRGDCSSTAGSVDKRIMFKQALATNLFTANGGRGFVPAHRQIAEFLAGRHLAERINKTDGSGLPVGRVIALLTGPAVEGVPTPLRGLSAWLAAHSARARRQLIKIDPVGVGLYGDIGAFTTSEKKHLLESLGAFAERSSLTGHRQGNAYSENTARVFRSLVSSDMASVIKSLLSRRSVTASEERFSSFLLYILSEADTSDLAALADLAPEMLGVLKDSGGSQMLALAALEAYIHVAPPSADKTRELKQLLEEVHTEMFPDPQDEIRGILLSSLYPGEITPSQVWRYLLARDPKLAGGHFWTFIHHNILALSQDNHVKELLSTLSELVLGWTNRIPSQEINSQKKSFKSLEHVPVIYSPHDLEQSLPSQLLERVLNVSDGDLDPSLLYDWLHITNFFSPLQSEGLKHTVNTIRVWFEARPGVQKAIYCIWLQRRADPDAGHGITGIPDYPPCTAMHGSRPSARLGLWCLKKAMEVLDTDIKASAILIDSARKSLEERGECRCFDCVWLELVKGVYKPSEVPTLSEALAVAQWENRHSRIGKQAIEAINRRIRRQDVVLKRHDQAAGARNCRQIADLRKRGQTALAWQLEKLAEARKAGEFPHAGQGDQRLEQREEQTTDRQERAETGSEHRADSFVERLECSIAATEGEEKQKRIGMLHDRNERVKRAEQEKQKRTEDWRNLICSQEAELSENRFSAQNLRTLARAYFDLFSGLGSRASPRDRISGLIGGDTTHVDAVMTSLRYAVERDDIPEMEAIIETRIQAREPYVAYPVLASLHMLSEEDPARLDRLSTTQKRKALAIHYCFSAHMIVDQAGFTSAVNPSAAWHRRLLKREPELVLEVLHECAAAGIRSGLDNPPGLYDLEDIERWNSQRTATSASAVGNGAPDSRAHSESANRGNAVGSGDPNLGSQIHDVRLRLLETHPACFPDEQKDRPTNSRYHPMETLDRLIAAVLRHIDRGHADTARLSSLARRKLALKSTTPAQRVRWLAVDFLASPHPRLRKLQDLAAYVNGNEIRVRHLAQFHCNTMKYDYPALSFLSGCRDPAVLRITIAMLGRSFSPLLMNGAVTPPMEMSDILSKSIHLLGSLTSGEAHEALTELIEGPELERWHSRLVRAREDQLVLYRDAAYRHPDIRQVQAALSDQAPATAADLAALLADRLSDIAEYLQGDSSNPWRQFWNVDSHGRPLRPRPEESCRDALLGELSKAGLPNGVAAAPEGYYAAATRADIKASFNGFNVPIEIKKNSHSRLWDSIHNQLIGQYTTDPATFGYGIFVVLWFGEQKQGRQTGGEQRNHWKTAKPPDGERPHTPEELKQRLTGTLTADEARKITVVVLDVTKPGAQSDQRVAV